MTDGERALLSQRICAAVRTSRTTVDKRRRQAFILHEIFEGGGKLAFLRAVEQNRAGDHAQAAVTNAASAFGNAHLRADQAAKETAEGEVLDRYLPKQLTDAEIAEIVTRALAAGGFSGKAQMGPAMKAAQTAVAGRAEGGRVAAEVRRQLA